MKTLILLLIPFFASSQLHKIQNFTLNASTHHWQAIGEPYFINTDTLAILHGYRWKREKIVAIQDYKKINGKFVKYGEPYPKPDTLNFVHGFIK